MCDGHVNVLIHWGVYGNSTFRLHARGLETRPLETDPLGEGEGAGRGGGRNTLNPTAMLYARPNVITRTAAAAATQLRICFRFVFEAAAAGVFSSQAAACRRGHGRDRIRSRARFHPQVPVPERVPLSRPRVYTSADDRENVDLLEDIISLHLDDISDIDSSFTVK